MSRYKSFGEFTTAEQIAMATAPRPRVHIEPLKLGTKDGEVSAIHLQIGDGHCLMMLNDMAGFQDALRAAYIRLGLAVDNGGETQH